ncbi:MAG TPA: hypothetical protein VFO65_03700 [Acidimicrobiales bacterium]|nr:hypothetical protein [Acidimicrobiales bacterium]
MKRLMFSTYTFKDRLDEGGYRELVKRFGEIGNAPGVLAHYVRLDGRGGFTISEEIPGKESAVYETVLEYGSYINFESTPIAAIEDALPSIVKIFG